MYAFLDSHQAAECGDSNACLKFEYEQDLIAELKTAIEQQVTLNRRARIYVIFRDSSGEYKGRFIFGRRKRAPWEGYGVTDWQEEDDIAL